jgi:DNA-binding NtrC family response regulator
MKGAFTEPSRKIGKFRFRMKNAFSGRDQKMTQGMQAKLLRVLGKVFTAWEETAIRVDVRIVAPRTKISRAR